MQLTAQSFEVEILQFHDTECLNVYVQRFGNRKSEIDYDNMKTSENVFFDAFAAEQPVGLICPEFGFLPHHLEFHSLKPSQKSAEMMLQSERDMEGKWYTFRSEEQVKKLCSAAYLAWDCEWCDSRMKNVFWQMLTGFRDGHVEDCKSLVESAPVEILWKSLTC